MVRKVVFRPAARRDLEALYDYIRDNRKEPDTALRYIQRIRTYCQNLADFPERGTRRDDIRTGLRIVGLERQVTIAFSFDHESVRIARIFYRGRDYEALLADDD